MEAWARAVLEGRRGGVSGLVGRALLSPLGLVYGALMAARAGLYARGVLKSESLAVPVVSVGNLTVGGTGKTPFTIWLARRCLSLGKPPAILVRGYGHQDPQQADEVQLYRSLLPDVPVYPGADRCASARMAVDKGADVLLLDDGFQHLRLVRNLDIVLLDATCPFGGGLPLPAGVQREFTAALARAQVFVLTRTDQAPAEKASGLREELQERFPGRPVLCARHSPERLQELNGKPLALADLRGRRVIALCAIGRPDAFSKSLRALGADVQDTVALPDHSEYQEADLRTARLAASSHSATIVTTEKDAPKLLRLVPEVQQREIWVLGVEMTLADETPLVVQLQKL